MTDYERYQLNWMIEHGYSLEDFVRVLSWYVQHSGAEDGLLTVFAKWQNEYGFNGEIYACEDEYYDNEYLMEEEE